MTDAVALRPARAIPERAVLVLIGVGFALAGLGVRYLAYVNVVPDASLATFADGLCRWDCAWYVRISEEGYDGFPVSRLINAGNWAFFPAFPVLVAIFRPLTALPSMVAGTVLSIALSIGAGLVAWPLLGRNLRAYTLLSAYLLCGPFSIYFTTFYSEVLFFFLIICVFAALQRQQFLLAGLFAAVLSATRIVGVFIVFAILVEVWSAHRQGGGTWRDFVPAMLRRSDILLAFAIAPLGLFAYMAYLHFHVGDALAFNNVQRAWGRPFGNPAVFLWTALTDFPRAGFIPSISQQLGIATLAGYVLALGLLLRRQYAMAVYSAVCLILPLFAGMSSMLRFVAGLAPLPLLLVQLLAATRWSAALALLAFIVADYYCTVGWLTEYLTLV